MDTKTGGSGVGCFTVLLIVFLVLKLTGLISWPWVWVLAPLWIPIAIALIILFIAALIKIASD